MTALTLALIEMLLKYGPTVYIDIIQGLGTNEPTLEQIQALIVKAPESYFED